ncbi:MAG: hypothetical protein KIT74_05245 [Fimbriimonadales bacterium]|nr:hypothetical protein [Fimbriimonadales bacterium]
MIHLLAAALAATQLGWRAGTPEPILEAEPELVAMYWHVWEAYREGVIEEASGGLPTPIYAPGGRLGASELVTGSLFTRWAWRATGAFESLDAYLLLADRAGNLPQFWILRDRSPVGVQERPLFGSFAAWQLYKISGDKATLGKAFSQLARVHSRQTSRYTAEDGVRGVGQSASLVPEGGGWSGSDCAEASAILLIESHYLALCAKELGLPDAESAYRRAASDEAKRLSKMWSESDGVFRAWEKESETSEVATIVPMLSLLTKRPELPDSTRIVASLNDGETFRSRLPYSAVAQFESTFRGDAGVRPLLQYLALRTIIEHGDFSAAAYASGTMLNALARTWRRERKFYSEYGATTLSPSPGSSESSFDAGYLVVAGLIEAVLGFDVDAGSETVLWRMTRKDRHGIERLRFGNNHVSLITAARETSDARPVITVKAERPFTLRVTIGPRTFSKRFSAGETKWEVR